MPRVRGAPQHATSEESCIPGVKEATSALLRALDVPSVEALQSKYPAPGPCTRSWPAGEAACRCLTCGTAPFSAICIECFNASDHVGHDYVVYLSSAGGSCDCGDPLAWKPAGCCKRHRPAPAAAIPFELEARSRCEAETALASLLSCALDALMAVAHFQHRSPYVGHAFETICPALDRHEPRSTVRAVVRLHHSAPLGSFPSGTAADVTGDQRAAEPLSVPLLTRHVGAVLQLLAAVAELPSLRPILAAVCTAPTADIAPALLQYAQQLAPAATCPLARVAAASLHQLAAFNAHALPWLDDAQRKLYREAPRAACAVSDPPERLWPVAPRLAHCAVQTLLAATFALPPSLLEPVVALLLLLLRDAAFRACMGFELLEFMLPFHIQAADPGGLMRAAFEADSGIASFMERVGVQVFRSATVDGAEAGSEPKVRPAPELVGQYGAAAALAQPLVPPLHAPYATLEHAALAHIVLELRHVLQLAASASATGAPLPTVDVHGEVIHQRIHSRILADVRVLMTAPAVGRFLLYDQAANGWPVLTALLDCLALTEGMAPVTRRAAPPPEADSNAIMLSFEIEETLLVTVGSTLIHALLTIDAPRPEAAPRIRSMPALRAVQRAAQLLLAFTVRHSRGGNGERAGARRQPTLGDTRDAAAALEGARLPGELLASARAASLHHPLLRCLMAPLGLLIDCAAGGCGVDARPPDAAGAWRDDGGSRRSVSADPEGEGDVAELAAAAQVAVDELLASHPAWMRDLLQDWPPPPGRRRWEDGGGPMAAVGARAVQQQGLLTHAERDGRRSGCLAGSRGRGTVEQGHFMQEGRSGAAALQCDWAPLAAPVLTFACCAAQVRHNLWPYNSAKATTAAIVYSSSWRRAVHLDSLLLTLYMSFLPPPAAFATWLCAFGDLSDDLRDLAGARVGGASQALQPDASLTFLDRLRTSGLCCHSGQNDAGSRAAAKRAGAVSAMCALLALFRNAELSLLDLRSRVRRSVVQVLAVEDDTHGGLQRRVGNMHIYAQKEALDMLDNVLEEVATVREADTHRATMYTLRRAAWQHFDPHALCISPAKMQQAQGRAADFADAAHSAQAVLGCCAPLPFGRVLLPALRVLESPDTLRILNAFLAAVVHAPDTSRRIASPAMQLLAMCLHHLQPAIGDASGGPSQQAYSSSSSIFDRLDDDVQRDIMRAIVGRDDRPGAGAAEGAAACTGACPSSELLLQRLACGTSEDGKVYSAETTACAKHLLRLLQHFRRGVSLDRDAHAVARLDGACSGDGKAGGLTGDSLKRDAQTLSPADNQSIGPGADGSAGADAAPAVAPNPAAAKRRAMLAEMASQQAAFLSMMDDSEASDDERPALDAASQAAGAAHEPCNRAAPCRFDPRTAAEHATEACCLCHEGALGGGTQCLHERGALLACAYVTSSGAFQGAAAPCALRLHAVDRCQPWSVLSCGHRMHRACHSQYMSTQVATTLRKLQTSLDPESGDFQCPVCRLLCNCLLPAPSDISSFKPSAAPSALPVPQPPLFISDVMRELSSHASGAHCAPTPSFSDPSELTSCMAQLRRIFSAQAAFQLPRRPRESQVVVSGGNAFSQACMSGMSGAAGNIPADTPTSPCEALACSSRLALCCSALWEANQLRPGAPGPAPAEATRRVAQSARNGMQCVAALFVHAAAVDSDSLFAAALQSQSAHKQAHRPALRRATRSFSSSAANDAPASHNFVAYGEAVFAQLTRLSTRYSPDASAALRGMHSGERAMDLIERARQGERADATAAHLDDTASGSADTDAVWRQLPAALCNMLSGLHGLEGRCSEPGARTGEAHAGRGTADETARQRTACDAAELWLRAHVLACCGGSGLLPPADGAAAGHSPMVHALSPLTRPYNRPFVHSSGCAAQPYGPPWQQRGLPGGAQPSNPSSHPLGEQSSDDESGAARSSAALAAPDHARSDNADNERSAWERRLHVAGEVADVPPSPRASPDATASSWVPAYDPLGLAFALVQPFMICTRMPSHREPGGVAGGPDGAPDSVGPAAARTAASWAASDATATAVARGTNVDNAAQARPECGRAVRHELLEASVDLAACAAWPIAVLQGAVMAAQTALLAAQPHVTASSAEEQAFRGHTLLESWAWLRSTAGTPPPLSSQGARGRPASGAAASCRHGEGMRELCDAIKAITRPFVLRLYALRCALSADPATLPDMDRHCGDVEETALASLRLPGIADTLASFLLHERPPSHTLSWLRHLHVSQCVPRSTSAPIPRCNPTSADPHAEEETLHALLMRDNRSRAADLAAQLAQQPADRCSEAAFSSGEAVAQTALRQLPAALLSLVMARPQLPTLPTHYLDLYLPAAREKCYRCGCSPANPLLCLQTHRVLCSFSQSCEWKSDEAAALGWGPQQGRSLFSVLEHTHGVCGYTGVFIELRSTEVVILCGKRVAQMPSLYLDAYGEEDAALHRGKPLVLSARRMCYLNALFRSGALERDSRAFDGSTFIS